MAASKRCDRERVDSETLCVGCCCPRDAALLKATVAARDKWRRRGFLDRAAVHIRASASACASLDLGMSNGVAGVRLERVCAAAHEFPHVATAGFGASSTLLGDLGLPQKYHVMTLFRVQRCVIRGECTKNYLRSPSFHVLQAPHNSHGRQASHQYLTPCMILVRESHKLLACVCSTPLQPMGNYARLGSPQIPVAGCGRQAAVGLVPSCSATVRLLPVKSDADVPSPRHIILEPTVLRNSCAVPFGVHRCGT